MEMRSKLGVPPETLSEYVDQKIFDGPLNEAFSNEGRDVSKGGRPPFDKIMMFKALLIQSLYNLSDDQLEYPVADRARFKRFLGIKKAIKCPPAKHSGHLGSNS